MQNIKRQKKSTQSYQKYRKIQGDYRKEKKRYYESERCLITRLKKYVDDHLRFLKDFRIDFTNNLAERELTKIKTK